MKTKIVPASGLSTKSLLAKDYVTSPVVVTVVEEVERDYLVYLDVDTSDEAQSRLEEMSDAELMATIRKGKRRDTRVIERHVAAAVIDDRLAIR